MSTCIFHALLNMELSTITSRWNSFVIGQASLGWNRSLIVMMARTIPFCLLELEWIINSCWTSFILAGMVELIGRWYLLIAINPFIRFCERLGDRATFILSFVNVIIFTFISFSSCAFSSCVLTFTLLWVNFTRVFSCH